MMIRRWKDKSIEFSRIESIEAELLKQVPAAGDSEGEAGRALGHRRSADLSDDAGREGEAERQVAADLLPSVASVSARSAKTGRVREPEVRNRQAHRGDVDGREAKGDDHGRSPSQQRPQGVLDQAL